MCYSLFLTVVPKRHRIMDSPLFSKRGRKQLTCTLTTVYDPTVFTHGTHRLSFIKRQATSKRCGSRDFDFLTFLDTYKKRFLSTIHFGV